ncbi:MAG: hypothetical protein WED33_10225 [Bacteroidia bacterium]
MDFSKNCLECRDLIQGRSDKKFCSDICRTAYHNKTRVISDPAVKEVNRILSRNRQILLTCVDRKSPAISEGYLMARGFNFNYFTHQIEDTSGTTSIFCYEIGYKRRQNNLLLLVKEDEDVVYRKQL